MDTFGSSIVTLDFMSKTVINRQKSQLARQESRDVEYVGIEQENVYGNKERIIMQLLVFCSFCGQAMQMSLVGPTLLHVGFILDCDLLVISFVFAFQYIGVLLGCILCGIFYSKFNEEIQFAITNFIMGIANIFCVWMPHVSGFFALKTIHAIATGYNDILSHSQTLKMWDGHKLKPIVYSTLLVIYPLGSFIAPIIAAPFLDTIDIYVEYTSTTLMSYDLSTVQVYNNDLTSHENTDEPNIEKARFSYMIVGCISVFVCVGFGIKFLKKKVHVTAHIESKTNIDYSTHTKPKKLLIVLICFISFLTALNLINIWIAPFVVEYLQWDPKHGSLISACYWLGMFIGRIIGVLLLFFINAGVLLVVNLVLTFISVLLTCFATVMYQNIIWICVTFVGFSGRF